MDELVVIGKIGAPHGVRGSVKIISYAEPKQNIFNYAKLYIKPQGDIVELKFSIYSISAKIPIIKLNSCNDRDEAALLTNSLIYIEKSQLSDLKEDEYYWDDLIGLNVEDNEQTPIGVVSQIIATGSHDILMIEQDKLTFLISYRLNDTILSVSLENKLITINKDFLISNDD